MLRMKYIGFVQKINKIRMIVSLRSVQECAQFMSYHSVIDFNAKSNTLIA